jgi:L-threonylcarbamoyladenylate synthase
MLFWDLQADIEVIKKILQEEKIVIGTSDTVLGFLSPLSERGFLMLNALKGRTEKPYIVLVGSLQKAQEFSDDFAPGKPAYILGQKFWPGPLTLIVSAKKDLPSWLRSKNGTIALRFPAHEGLQKLLVKLPGLFSTSANKSGEAVPLTIDDVDSTIKEKCAGIIIDRAAKVTTIASTIVDCTQAKPTVIRQGAIPQETIESFLGSCF